MTIAITKDVVTKLLSIVDAGLSKGVGNPKAGQMTFIEFWAAINSVCKSHGISEILYGEARDRWAESQGWKN